MLESHPFFRTAHLLTGNRTVSWRAESCKRWRFDWISEIKGPSGYNILGNECDKKAFKKKKKKERADPLICIKELMQFKEFCPKSYGERIITSESISCSFILPEFFPPKYIIRLACRGKCAYLVITNGNFKAAYNCTPLFCLTCITPVNLISFCYFINI